MTTDRSEDALGEVFFQSISGPIKFLADKEAITALMRPEDVDPVIDALLADRDVCALAQVFSYKRPARSSGAPDHLVDVGICRERRSGVISFSDQDGAYATWNPLGRASMTRYYLVGDPRDFPAYSEVPIDLVREAVKEFLRTGGQRPSCVQWQNYEALPPDDGEDDGEDPWVASGAGGG